MKKFFVSTCAISAILLSGCFSASRARFFATNAPHKIEVYSGGKAVKTYHSVGRVLSEGESDGWYFEDKATGKLVHVSGTVVIEQE